jgi:hypothetical protein
MMVSNPTAPRAYSVVALQSLLPAKCGSDKRFFPEQPPVLVHDFQGGGELPVLLFGWVPRSSDSSVSFFFFVLLLIYTCCFSGEERPPSHQDSSVLLCHPLAARRSSRHLRSQRSPRLGVRRFRVRIQLIPCFQRACRCRPLSRAAARTDDGHPASMMRLEKRRTLPCRDLSAARRGG